MGIGLVKGSREINLRALGGVAIGWVTTPLAAGISTYFMLFFIQNLFNLPVSNTQQNTVTTEALSNFELNDSLKQYDFILPGIIILAALVIGLLLFIAFFYQQRKRFKAENQLLFQQNESYNAQKALSDIEIVAVQKEKENLSRKLENKRKEFIDVALNLSEQREFLEIVLNEVDAIKQLDDAKLASRRLQNLETLIRQRMTFKSAKEDFYGKIEQVHHDFLQKLETAFPDLTDNEKTTGSPAATQFAWQRNCHLNEYFTQKRGKWPATASKKRLGLSKNDHLITFN